jgi:1-deoxy-D-xylulose-5-phosphate reductoisomerase
MTGVALLGATGSIGASTLAVMDQHPERFRLVAATAHRNFGALEQIVRARTPDIAVLVNGSDELPPATTGTTWIAGRQALLDVVTHPDVDIVVNALVGAAGLEPTIVALAAGKRVALANKESLVCGGPLVMEAASAGGGSLIPVDSEHSAIFQCLQGGKVGEVERLILTASGGPFREYRDERLSSVSPDDALRHPTWSMGAKVTIDSATLANKALEVIEAHFLFGVGYDRIAAVVHPQSVIHSMVEFIDGSVLAQIGFPTMELPILYALSHPERLAYDCRRFDPVAAGSLTFEPLRTESFPAFTLGVEAGRAGGGAPAVFNAANEVAVAAFLDGRIGFPDIPAAIEHALSSWRGGDTSSVEATLAADRWARRTTVTFMEERIPC